MIKIGKKDVLIGYISYAFRMLSNLILLPIILNKLSSAEYGLWNVYVSLASVVNLLDIGFVSVITRYITYAYCGAETIEEKGISKVRTDGTPNYELLFRVFFQGKRIYKKIFVLAILIVMMMIPYVLYVGREIADKNQIVFSWLIHGISMCLYLYYVAYNCVIKGIGKIKESQLYYIVQQIMYLIITFVLLQLEYGITAVALGNFISVSVFRILNVKLIDREFKTQKPIMDMVKNDINREDDKINVAIKNNTKGLALVTLSTYIVNYGGTLICSCFLDLNQIASLGLTNQLISVIASITDIPFSTFRTKLGDFHLKNNVEKLKDYYSLFTVFSVVCYVLGGLCLLFLGTPFLKIIGSNTEILPTYLILLMLISSFVYTNHQRCTKFIMLGNRQPHIKAYTISSIASVLIAFVLLALTGNVGAYVITILVVQLVYNGWKWPTEVAKQLQLEQNEMLKCCLKSVKMILNKS